MYTVHLDTHVPYNNVLPLDHLTTVGLTYYRLCIPIYGPLRYELTIMLYHSVTIVLINVFPTIQCILCRHLM